MNRVLEAIRQILEAAVENASSPLYYNSSTAPTGVKAVFFGDPIHIEKSSHPALIVHPVSTDYEKRGSRYDDKIHTVEIRVVDNAENYLATTPSDVNKVSTVERFCEMIEKSNASQSVSSLAICGLIQRNPTLPYLDPNNADAPAVAAVDSRVKSVNYVFNSSRGYPTFEAIVIIEIAAIGDR